MAGGKGAEGDGRSRVIIEKVTPEINAGRFPIKRTPGESVLLEADIFADGHEVLSAAVKFRGPGKRDWEETPLEPLVNDRWRGEFVVSEIGIYTYTLEAWIDHFQTWRRDLEKKFKAGVNLTTEFLTGAQMLEAAATKAKKPDAHELRAAAANIHPDDPIPVPSKVAIALSSRLADLMGQYSAREFPAAYERELQVIVDPVRARFGAWYEMFPRSCSPVRGKHGTFQNCEAMLPRIAKMGFDVLYLPPVHPVGKAYRKGPNNRLAAGPEDPGSPWAIGSEEGGHKSIHPQLGTLDDFRRLVTKARESNIHVALDIAFQCSPDHPYVREHKDWFRIRPDGSIQYAENPPKRYQDIYPINFESPDWKNLWAELRSVFQFWIDQGVHIFRVDNPHTKSFHFWEWCISSLKSQHPELIFLSEAFTRPKVMYYLAKLGFTQSYNYFPWRNTKRELIEYFTELTQAEVKEYFRPNLWPNTPDILTQFLQYGGRPAFVIRYLLAATLGASYGIYGPAFELCEHKPRETGSEEYLDSEKYQLRHWDLENPGNLTDLITRVNRIRRENPALQSNESLQFHATDNEQVIAYSKSTADNLVLVILNLDPYHVQRGWVKLALDRWGIGGTETYQLHDLLTDARFLWSGANNFIELDPTFAPAHILVVKRYVRTERDFDYFI
jgi:starch synthase (maltosyl-transferring)